jgi:hypothetical protein
MKQYLFALTLCGLVFNAEATCPKRLSGKYVSSVEYTIMSQVSQPPGYQNSVANVRYDITSAEIKGNTLTFLKVFTAYAGSGEIAKEVEGRSFPVVFDPKTCSGYFGEAANPIYFVVGDSGNVIKSLKGTTPLSSTISASLGDFIRQ